MSKPFLRAKWLDIAMLNWKIDGELLEPFVPVGTELDYFNDQTYLSLIAFRFEDTRVLGLSVPFHRNFEEVNLRFYVKRTLADEVRRGVVFIKELVPRSCITLVARTLYNENYSTIRMTHQIQKSSEGIRLNYTWGTSELDIFGRNEPTPLTPDSLEEFITEHYWGYSSQRDGGTLEYRVDHPKWQVWTETKLDLNCDATADYGSNFGTVMSQPPTSSLIATGSAVTVYKGVRI